MQHFTSLYLKFFSNLLVKRVVLLNASSCHDNPEYNFTYTSCITCYNATQMAEIFHILLCF